MKVVLTSGAGLFADTFACWLRSLSPDIEILRRKPGTAQKLRGHADAQLALVDIDDMPQRRACAMVAKFRVQLPGARLVAIGTPNGGKFVKAITGVGADAYLPKSLGEAKARALLGSVLRSKLRRPGRTQATSDRTDKNATGTRRLSDLRPESRSDTPYGLTGRELDVLELACFGLSNLQIAKRHGISVGVVKLHLHHAYEKLGVQGRVQAIRIVEHLDAIRALHLQRADAAPALLECLLPHMSHERHRKGHVLFRKGEAGHAMYYVQQGRVRLTEIGVVMTAGEVFGELGVFAPTHVRTSSARCEDDTHLFKLTADQTKRLCFENPRFAYYLIRLIADRLVGERARGQQA